MEEQAGIGPKKAQETRKAIFEAFLRKLERQRPDIIIITMTLIFLPAR